MSNFVDHQVMKISLCNWVRKTETVSYLITLFFFLKIEEIGSASDELDRDSNVALKKMKLIFI